MKKIESVTVVTMQGVSMHSVGQNNVVRIEEEDLFITGDPYAFYCGYNESGERLFKISAFCPIEVRYENN